MGMRAWRPVMGPYSPALCSFIGICQRTPKLAGPPMPIWAVGQWLSGEKYLWRVTQTSMCLPTVPLLLFGTGMKSSAVLLALTGPHVPQTYSKFNWESLPRYVLEHSKPGHSTTGCSVAQWCPDLGLAPRTSSAISSGACPDVVGSAYRHVGAIHNTDWPWVACFTCFCVIFF